MLPISHHPTTRIRDVANDDMRRHIALLNDQVVRLYAGPESYKEAKSAAFSPLEVLIFKAFRKHRRLPR